MRLVTWNCNGRFRDKVSAINQLDADVYIIQECEDPKRVSKPSTEYNDFCSNFAWTGDDKNKGLGVFSKYKLRKKQEELDEKFGQGTLKWFLPLDIDEKLSIVGVWAHRADGGEFRYIGQFYKYLINNLPELTNSVIMGDFNSNAIWDYKRLEWGHSTCVRMLKEVGIESVYHRLRNEQHGKEVISTFFLQRNPNKPYHIDYVFSPEALIDKTMELRIETFDNWKHLSDHVPLLWEFMGHIT
jgi:exonuclease III